MKWLPSSGIKVYVSLTVSDLPPEVMNRVAIFVRVFFIVISVYVKSLYKKVSLSKSGSLTS